MTTEVNKTQDQPEKMKLPDPGFAVKEEAPDHDRVEDSSSAQEATTMLRPYQTSAPIPIPSRRFRVLDLAPNCSEQRSREKWLPKQQQVY